MIGKCQRIIVDSSLTSLGSKPFSKAFVLLCTLRQIKAFVLFCTLCQIKFCERRYEVITRRELISVVIKDCSKFRMLVTGSLTS
jgi:hypothetical protein